MPPQSGGWYKGGREGRFRRVKKGFFSSVSFLIELAISLSLEQIYTVGFAVFQNNDGQLFNDSNCRDIGLLFETVNRIFFNIKMEIWLEICTTEAHKKRRYFPLRNFSKFLEKVRKMIKRLE